MGQIHKQTIYKALGEPIFAKDVFSKLPPSEFGDGSYKIIVRAINRYYKTNDQSLGEASLLTLVEERMTNENMSAEKQDEVIDAVHDLYKLDETDTGDEVISESIQKFVRRTLARETIMKAVNKGDISDDQVLIDLVDGLRDVLTTEVGGNSGEIIDFFEDTEKKLALFQNLQVNTYPTGFFAIDSVAGGGLARGELGLVIAPSGGGKTMWAVNQTRNYVRQGLNVLYLPLEEKLDRMLLRFEQVLSKVKKTTLLENDEVNEPLFREIQRGFKYARKEYFDDVIEVDGKEMPNPTPVHKNPNQWGNLWIRKYKPQELTPSMLSQLISDVTIRKGKRVDVVMIDYPDLMKNPHFNGGNESDAGGKLYEDIRAIIQEYDVVGWALSQVNRSSYVQDIKNAGAIEGSKRKINAVELAFTINQTPEEFANGFLRVYLDKIRNNSGVSYDRIQYFKVIPETMEIRDETPEEREQHMRLLEDTGELGSKGNKKEKVHTPQEAQAGINDLNSKLRNGEWGK